MNKEEIALWSITFAVLGLSFFFAVSQIYAANGERIQDNGGYSAYITPVAIKAIGTPSYSGQGAIRNCPCCSSGSKDTNSDTVGDERIKTAIDTAISYYQNKYGITPDDAKATDFGCHIEVSLYKDGELIKTLAVYGDYVTEY